MPVRKFTISVPATRWHF